MTGAADIAALLEGYRSGATTPAEVLAAVDRRATEGDPAVWIDPPRGAALQARSAALAAVPDGPQRLPLYGVPVAVKDNIDVAGRPTTAACPAYARVPDRSATAVQRLEDAGAVIVGKTNLDQFATGLVGTRSPHGAPRNPAAPGYLPGGSSSGSACAVAAGLVPVALGTDTAGSGRVPAAMQGLVGLKPTRGIVSTTGVVPACRSLDCVSVFARTVRDASRALAVLAAFDPTDVWARPPAGRRLPPAPPVAGLRLGVPALEHVTAMDGPAEDAFARHVAELAALGLQPTTVSFAPLEAAAALLYGGPWLAERLMTVGPLLERTPEALDPAVRTVVAGGRGYSATDVFVAMDRLAGLRRQAEAMLDRADLLVVPSVPTVFTPADVAADPYGPNDVLGTFTNFANLLDLAAVAVPSGVRPDGVPVGFTLLGPACSDWTLLSVAAAHEAQRLAPGAPAPAGRQGGAADREARP